MQVLRRVLHALQDGIALLSNHASVYLVYRESFRLRPLAVVVLRVQVVATLGRTCRQIVRRVPMGVLLIKMWDPLYAIRFQQVSSE